MTRDELLAAHPEIDAHAYDPVPDHMHTCLECVRYCERPADLDGVCSALGGPERLEAQRKSCRMYWDQKEHEEDLERAEERARREREAAWTKNKNNPEMPPEWQTETDPCTGRETGPLPFCPTCHEMLFEAGPCWFCGQPIRTDEAFARWLEPPVGETMDCFNCGGKDTVQYTRSKFNGHRHGFCVQCGMHFAE